MAEKYLPCPQDIEPVGPICILALVIGFIAFLIAVGYSIYLFGFANRKLSNPRWIAMMLQPG